MGSDTDRIAAIRSPFAPHPANRVSLLPGDVVAVELPFSEAMMAARKSGQVWTVRLGNSSAQLIDAVGHEWGAPYLPCECGIFGDRHVGYHTYGKLISTRTMREAEAQWDRDHGQGWS
jgi:hypothetical protein